MSLMDTISGLWKPRASTPGPLDDFWFQKVPYQTNAGVMVNATTAMRVTAVYSCVRLLSETGASVPCYLYEKQKQGKTPAENHILYDILLNQPNDYQTPFEFWEQVIRCCALRGFFYARIVMDRMGRLGQIKELRPLNPERVLHEHLIDGTIRIKYTEVNGSQRSFSPNELFRVMFYTEEDGLTPISPVKANADTVGITDAAERYAASYLGNAASPGGVLQTDGKINDEARKAISDSWNRAYRGADRAGKVAVLDQGFEYKQISINSEDAQLLQTRQWQLTDICRIYRVPPHMVQDLSRSTFNNVEQQSLDFMVHTMRAWFRRIESAINRDLLIADERKIYFPAFDMTDLLTADVAARAEYNASGIQNGYLTPNEVRISEGLNPLPDHDETFIPNNLRKSSDPPPQFQRSTDPGQQSTNKGGKNKNNSNGKSKLNGVDLLDVRPV